MRPTRAGLGLIITTIACVIAGRVLGLLELFVLAAMGAAALILAAIYTSTVRLDLGVGRSATPARLRAGSPARVDLVLHNRGRRGTPVISAHDSVQDARGAALMLAPIRSGGEARIAYRLPTHRRGVIKVGPLDLTLGDPLGLTQARLRAAEVTNLMVHPKLIELKPLLAIAGHDPTAEQQPRRTLANSGDEFFALRPYVVGDELKRVNWRATARSDELVVRQEERPKTGRVTVILDRRRENYDDAGFERAVSAALSALHSAFRGGDALRFLTSATASSDTEIRSRSDLDAVDEQLALIDSTESASIVGCLEEQTRVGRGGTLVVVTGQLAKHLDTAVARARRTFGLVIVITCHTLDDPPGWVTAHDGIADLAVGWQRAMSSGTTATVRAP
ncbi:MAG: DUF58 domain-containing protein [Actinomycetia bacterium]|nr:DUF58 domain-containing protein [Actinomycetes bacterium]MCP5034376.1 DUF58 domain-containing protein [Actinomycetes bacterium]